MVQWGLYCQQAVYAKSNDGPINEGKGICFLQKNAANSAIFLTNQKRKQKLPEEKCKIPKCVCKTSTTPHLALFRLALLLF
jgi:hypothetical protein